MLPAPRFVIELYQYQVRYTPVRVTKPADTLSNHRKLFFNVVRRPTRAKAKATVSDVTSKPIPRPYSVMLSTPDTYPCRLIDPKMTDVKNPIVHAIEAMA